MLSDAQQKSVNTARRTERSLGMTQPTREPAEGGKLGEMLGIGDIANSERASLARQVAGAGGRSYRSAGPSRVVGDAAETPGAGVVGPSNT